MDCPDPTCPGRSSISSKGFKTGLLIAVTTLGIMGGWATHVYDSALAQKNTNFNLVVSELKDAISSNLTRNGNQDESIQSLQIDDAVFKNQMATVLAQQAEIKQMLGKILEIEKGKVDLSGGIR